MFLWLLLCLFAAVGVAVVTLIACRCLEKRFGTTASAPDVFQQQFTRLVTHLPYKSTTQHELLADVQQLLQMRTDSIESREAFVDGWMQVERDRMHPDYKRTRADNAAFERLEDCATDCLFSLVIQEMENRACLKMMKLGAEATGPCQIVQHDPVACEAPECASFGKLPAEY